MKNLTEKQILDTKISFVHEIMPKRKKFKSTHELVEKLKMYKSLYAICDDIERTLVQGMITDYKTIPRELIEEKVEIKEIYECSYFCPSCNERMADMKSFKRTIFGKQIVEHIKTRTTEYTEYQMGHLTCPNEFQVICVNRKCVRYGNLMDIELLKKSVKVQPLISEAELNRSKTGKFKSNK